MANLKNLIGKALNRATSSKPSDEGNGTKTRVIKKGMTPKQGREYKHEEVRQDTRNAIEKLEKLTRSYSDKRPSYNTNAPASTKTPQPAPIQAAKEKRDKIQATFGGPKQIASRGGTGMKTELSPAYKESKAADVKRLTKPGGLKSELTQYERTLGRRRKDKFSNE
jgi:hypothetical protein